MQTNLFQEHKLSGEYQDHELGNTCIREYPSAFTSAQASTLFTSLQSSIPWQQVSIRIAGKTIEVPRLQCWMGNKNCIYGYSGTRLQPQFWQTDVLAIRQRVQQLAGKSFNSVLLNYYRTGQDSVAWHADNERELGPDPIIASVSFGAERYLQLKPSHRTGKLAYRILLRHGSVLVMGKGMQINWLHQLPKVRDLNLPRINLTFREVQQYS